MKSLRIMVAVLSLVSVAFVFVVPAAAVCRLLGLMTRVQFVPAMLAGEIAVVAAIVLLTLLCGRVYCSVLCPLGIAQDLMAWLVRPFRAARGSGKVNSVARYAILALFAVGMAFGLVGLIEPYGIFGRFLSVGVMRFGEPATLVAIWAVALFLAVMLMTFYRPRWWCNQVCPVGTLLGIVSRFAWLRVRIDGAKCVGCGACAKACDKGAIDKDGGKVSVDASKCVMCMECRGSCGKDALRWK